MFLEETNVHKSLSNAGIKQKKKKRMIRKITGQHWNQVCLVFERKLFHIHTYIKIYLMKQRMNATLKLGKWNRIIQHGNCSMSGMPTPKFKFQGHFTNKN